MSYDLAKIRADFPILSREVNGKPLVYLDNGASAQKPQVVIDAITQAYSMEYANVHRGLHYLSNLATEHYEAVRGKIARFLGAAHEDEIIFTSGSTEGINLVSYGWAAPHLKAGDEILVSVLEHHANIVPWHFLRERQGVVLKWVEPEADGSLPAEKVLAAITPKTKLIAITQMSNVTGTLVDVAAIGKGTSVPIMVDGSQAAVHMPIDVSSMGVDFYVITGHKLYGPSGSGAIWISRERQAEMRPFLGGGDMIRTVTRDSVDYAAPPLKFEAGTPGIVNQIGLGAALDYLTGLGMENVAAHEKGLRDYARDQLRALNWLQVQGDSPDKGAIFSMTMQGAHAHDISTILDKKGIAVRAGTHCAMPLLEFFGVTASARASFGLYNTKAEVDALIDGLKFCRELFA
ncbi:cysteine desulfurase [Paracoccus aminophilus]|uniref:Cysteine desulfurase n=1 Tax=Paracoccus aminophilus JCM 7686 TaxID=1367847 RepID=S5YV96_PARAH|nr:cysteine desulfurase [Paracoccus aminophilus]AGT09111.1 cysteine desulfurase/selenocysteine lyase [Paracoccus aminophilus JCM 7686]